MDDPLLMRVLEGIAGLEEQLQPIANGESMTVAVVGDRHARHELHDEEGPAVLADPGVVDSATLGWFISAKACRSDSKRATICFESIPSLISFRAMRRRIGSDCSAR